MKEIVNKWVYLAGPLFSRGEVRDRLEDENILLKTNILKEKDFVLNLKVFNPIKFNNNVKEETPYTFFDEDYKQICTADIMIADLDNLDSGTLAELGLFLSKVIMHPDRFKCYCIWSNWKIKTVPNKFVSGMILRHCKTFNNIEELSKELIDDIIRERKK